MAGKRLTRPYERLYPGQRRISAIDTNRVYNDLEAAQRGVRPPRQHRQTTDTQATANRTRRFIIAAIKPDYLEAWPFDGTEADTTAKTLIARPPRLRGTEASRGAVVYSGYSSDGQTRTATLGEETEQQKITPDYLIDDEIFATPQPIGGSGVAVADQDLQYIDDNRDGRVWAEA